MADMKAKARARGGNRPGEDNNAAKLTQAQVDDIRHRYPTTSARKLAAEFGVHRTTITRIVSGERWRKS